MTINELYKWAVQNGVEDYNIEIQYRDDGGIYDGTDKELYLTKIHDDKTLIL